MGYASNFNYKRLKVGKVGERTSSFLAHVWILLSLKFCFVITFATLSLVITKKKKI